MNTLRYYALLVLMLFSVTFSLAQQDTTVNKEDPTKEKQGKKKEIYYRQEEVLFDGKRYRRYNNFLTMGPAFLNSTIRTQSQKGVGIDFQYHIRRQYFQTGVMMSGIDFGNNNNVTAHLGYGLRRERNYYSLAFFGGPSYSYGVEGDINSLPVFYSELGFYVSAQAVTKFTYDLGLGVEVFADFSAKQTLAGLKIIAFFSGGYRGPKRNYNPNVRSENPKWQK
jgi:hypothetical protein